MPDPEGILSPPGLAGAILQAEPDDEAKAARGGVYRCPQCGNEAAAIVASVNGKTGRAFVELSPMVCANDGYHMKRDDRRSADRL